MKRINNINVLHLGKKLLQQYIVDVYAKVEEERLNFIRFNQKQLRAELYQGLRDAICAGLFRI
jgi:hypothetical protein